jgi:hypothetical protein
MQNTGNGSFSVIHFPFNCPDVHSGKDIFVHGSSVNHENRNWILRRESMTCLLKNDIKTPVH